MQSASRKIAFVLAATDHGTMIVNRLDYAAQSDKQMFGVGYDLLETAAYSPGEVQFALSVLELRRRYAGDGVVAVDCGANIGVHTVEWARRMTGWGSVIAIEAQERIYYALAGNIAISNCLNARALHAAAAAAAEPGRMRMPIPDYLRPMSFGSLELRQREKGESIGQTIDYSQTGTVEIGTLSIDSLALPRIDLLKIDVEGMEFEVLAGAAGAIAASHPILMVEWFKVDKEGLKAWLTDRGYVVFELGLNLVAIHGTDPCLGHIKK